MERINTGSYFSDHGWGRWRFFKPQFWNFSYNTTKYMLFFIFMLYVCKIYLMEVLRGAGENISSSKGTQPKIVSSGPGKLAKIFRILARIFSHIGPGPPPGWPPPAEK